MYVTQLKGSNLWMQVCLANEWIKRPHSDETRLAQAIEEGM